MTEFLFIKKSRFLNIASNKTQFKKNWKMKNSQNNKYKNSKSPFAALT